MASVYSPLLKEESIVAEGRRLPSKSESVRIDLDCSPTCGLTDASDEHGESSERGKVRRKLILAIALCFVFMTVEVVGGVYSNSLAILTDAAHLLSDVAGFAISLFALWMSGWEATPTHSFGYHRMEILGAMVSMQLIWMITGVLVFEAISRLISNDHEVDGRLMFATSAFGVAVNILMTAILGHHHGHGHDHSHGHSHGQSQASNGAHHDHGHEHVLGNGDHDHGHKHQQQTASEHQHSHEADEAGSAHGRSMSDSSAASSGHGHSHHNLAPSTPVTTENINLRGAYLHVLGDLIQSVGVMIGGAVIWWKPEWKIVDLICTLLFSVLVLFTTFKMLRDIIEVLMESTPREINATELEEGIRKLDGVVDVHELHIWAITKGKVVLACHVTTTPSGDTDQILHAVLEFCETEYGISHATVQVERNMNHSS